MFNLNTNNFDSSKNASKAETKSVSVITSLDNLKAVSGGRGSGNYPRKRFSYTQRR